MCTYIHTYAARESQRQTINMHELVSAMPVAEKNNGMLRPSTSNRYRKSSNYQCSALVHVMSVRLSQSPTASMNQKPIYVSEPCSVGS